MREIGYKDKIQSMSSTMHEYELREKLLEKRAQDYIKFDLEDLDKKLREVDVNLERATVDS